MSLSTLTPAPLTQLRIMIVRSFTLCLHRGLSNPLHSEVNTVQDHVMIYRLMHKKTIRNSNNIEILSSIECNWESSINHVVKILGISDSPPPFRVTFTK